MRVLSVVLDDAVYEALEMEAGDSTPAAVGLVAAQMIAYAIETDDLGAAPAV